MNCPKCGAKVAADYPGVVIFECGTELDKDPEAIYEVKQCVRNQLATVTAERDAARAERDTLKAACDEFMVWYDSDGSVGGLDNLMFDWRRKVQPEFFTDRATAEKGAKE